MSKSKPRAESYLKKRIPNYDPTRILVTHKAQGEIVIPVAGKLVNIMGHGGYYESHLDALVGKLKEYFDTGHWDTNTYYLMYGDDKFKYVDSVVIIPEDATDAMSKIRDAYTPNIGFKKVDKTGYDVYTLRDLGVK